MKKIYLVLLPLFMCFLVDGQQEEQKKSFDYKEKVFVHTSSNEFFVGEEIGVAFYALDYQDNSLPLSQVGYVDVIDSEGSIIFNATIALNDGVGQGSIFIPSATSTGNYQLIAYTKWILNNGVGSFQKPITIINPFRTYINPNKPSVSISYQIVGNRLVADIPNQVYYTALNTPSKFSVQVQSSEGEIVSTSGEATGNFTFVPKNEIYYSISVFDSITQIRKTERLPQTIRSGMTALFNASNDSIQFNYTDASSEFSIQCVVSDKDEVVLYNQVLGDMKGQFGVEMNLEDKKGIYKISCLNSKNKNLLLEFYRVYGFEEDVFTTFPNYLSNEDVSFPISDFLAQVKPRSFSVSVRKQNLMSDQDDNSLSNHILLAAETENRSTSYPFVNKVNWYEKNTRSILPDFRGMVLSVNSQSGGFGQNQVAFSTPEQSYFTNNFTDSLVNANFLVSTSVRENSYISMEGLSTQIPDFQNVTHNLTGLLSADKPTSLILNSSNTELINERMIQIQIANAFKKQLIDSDIEENLMFYGTPTSVFKLDEYTRFPSIEEVIKEIILGLRLRGDFESTKLSVADVLGQVFIEEPLILFNSIPVNDHSAILSLDPLKVQKVEVVREKYFLNDRVYGGIVHFIPYDAGMLFGVNSKLVPRALIPQTLKNENLVPENYPDYREQLLWAIFNESQEIPEVIKFKTSNSKGDYIISVQGVLENNEPFSYKAKFKVK